MLFVLEYENYMVSTIISVYLDYTFWHSNQTWMACCYDFQWQIVYDSKWNFLICKYFYYVCLIIKIVEWWLLFNASF